MCLRVILNGLKDLNVGVKIFVRDHCQQQDSRRVLHLSLVFVQDHALGYVKSFTFQSSMIIALALFWGSIQF
ncbi:hypothetical protein VIGAN_01484200 [Vigna angularis var. angularis]|uniref:Uncharacterized protein n=1 Tax=Vigna angularis var. angularis TaxID=157739 RepID=A0A0S3R845_PHAAN|nr:hypothetical protein VIGAN_01484200 [Vigna angularis var. angularis]